MPAAQLQALMNLAAGREFLVTHYHIRILRGKKLVSQSSYELTKKGWQALRKKNA